MILNGFYEKKTFLKKKNIFGTRDPLHAIKNVHIFLEYISQEHLSVADLLSQPTLTNIWRQLKLVKALFLIVRHSRGIKNPVVKYIPYSKYDIHTKISSNFIKKTHPFEPILHLKKLPLWAYF